MVQALITVNSVAGSNTDLAINTSVQLNNTNNGGESTFAWQILDQPVGTTDSLSNAALQNPTFTPKKEGTYLIELVVNASLASEARNRVVCRVRQLKTRTQVPAAGETTESGSRGHAAAVEEILKLVDTIRADPGVLVIQLGYNATAKDVVRFTDSAVIKSGLPGQETVPVATLALATQAYVLTEELGLVMSAVDGGALSSGKLAYVRMLGLQTGCTIASVVDEDPIYVSDTGGLSRTVGTNTRRVGKAVSASAGVAAVFFRGFGPV